MKLSLIIVMYNGNTVLSVTRKKVWFVHRSLNGLEEEKVSDMGIIFPYVGLKCGLCVSVCRFRMGTGHSDITGAVRNSSV
jgi:hypothetical protein